MEFNTQDSASLVDIIKGHGWTNHIALPVQ
jgi:hypothetical protein